MHATLTGVETKVPLPPHLTVITVQIHCPACNWAFTTTSSTGSCPPTRYHLQQHWLELHADLSVDEPLCSPGEDMKDLVVKDVLAIEASLREN